MLAAVLEEVETYILRRQTHYSPIYRDSSDIGVVSGGGAATGSAYGHEMVGSGRVGLGGSAGEGEGSGGVGADRKVGRWRRDEGLRRRG